VTFRTARAISALLLAPIVLLSALPAQDPVDQLLGRLTLEQKAGQLFVSWSLSRPSGDNHEQMLRWVEEVGLGGVILSLGSCEDAATLIPKLQAKAQVPLLMAGDFEGGVWFRLQGATELGNQMLVGATGDERLAEAMGRVTGREAKALGFHWVFAPVLDVNSNPQNPIINVRSFGEDPALVSRLGRAFARGVRGAGLISCGKHFPGHGDVASDSHMELPTVPGDGDRLRRVELRPFGDAAREGLESVMTGHLAVPGLGEAANVPATLSRKILGDVLRDELGFTGLVVTDALDMGGVKNAFSPGEVAVRALLAGADVLLMPPEPLVARQAVVDAVESGRVPMARLDDAVRRILGMKQRVGLLDGGGRVADDWQRQLRRPEAVTVAKEIAAAGPVLVRERDGALAAVRRGAAGTVLVTILDKDDGQGGEFAERMRAVVPQPDESMLRLSGTSSDEQIAAARRKVALAETVVAAIYVKVRESSGGVAVPARLRPVLEQLQAKQKVVVVSFGNPYLVQDLPHADAYVAAFAATSHVQRAVADALRGTGRLVGRLPVAIPGVAEAGDGLSLRPPFGGNAIDTELVAAIRAHLDAAVADRAFPGAMCVVTRRGDVVARVAAGRVSYADDAPAVTKETRYDLASLTKVCATTPAVLRLVAEGKLSLDDPVQKYVPEFVGAGKEQVTVRHLLAHQGGLPSYVRFFRSLEGRDAILAAAAKEGLMLEPGTAVRYSDLGFMLLMQVVEKASGVPYALYVRRFVSGPLGMDAFFTPTAGEPCDAAPTEDDRWRGRVVQGHVHDENAYAMGGVSGHAGLFATADGVARYGTALLAGGAPVLPRAIVAEATRPSGIGSDTTRGLGFQLLRSGSWAGTEVPAGTFGHTGFTGTSLWCSPRHDVCVVLLSNRVHPTRVNNKITSVRRRVHDAVVDWLR
jgi:beta-glucosidase-like glycosyl hydrolase/CubicO group peptidase (beta-lactamase class C family)